MAAPFPFRITRCLLGGRYDWQTCYEATKFALRLANQTG